jgi:hypothetical protein
MQSPEKIVQTHLLVTARFRNPAMRCDWGFKILVQRKSNEYIIMIIYSFTSRSRIFHVYGDVTIAGEGLQNLGLCSALRAFEQRGIFIVPHLL